MLFNMKFDFDGKKKVFEDGEAMTSPAPPAVASEGGNSQVQGQPGGVSAPYQTVFNTPGIGNPRPAGMCGNYGSGDRWDNLVIKSRKSKKMKG